MNVRARFKCHEVRRLVDSEVVSLQPVYSSNKETPNGQWSQYTPSGKIEMSITAKGAIGVFEPGEEYDVLFSPVPKPAEQS